MENENKNSFEYLKEILIEGYQLLSKYSFIPLGNSSVQNIFLVPQEEYSLGRKLRAYYLQLWSKMQAFEENYLKLIETELEIEKLNRLLEKTEDEIDKQLIKVKIVRHRNFYKYTYKLFMDCFKEMKDVIYAIKQLPEITLEEFEKQEFEHFKNRMIAQSNETPQINTLKALGYQMFYENGNYLLAPINENAEKTLQGRIEEMKEKENYEQVKYLFERVFEYLPKLPSINYLPNFSSIGELPELPKPFEVYDTFKEKLETE